MNITHENETAYIGANQADDLTWTIIVYFVLLSCGCVLNLVHALALIRSRRNGILSLLLQMCLVDAASTYVAVSEILALVRSSWCFSSELCPLFQGSEVLINTLTVYLIICFNFQVVSLWNLHEIEVKKNARNPLTSCGGRDDSSECLVTKHDNTHRLVTIDYRKRREDISTIFPTIFVWTVSLSLSIPNYTLSSTLKLKENNTLCAVIDTDYGKVLQHSLLLFRIILPLVFLLLSLFMLVAKLNQTSKSDIDNVLTKKMCEVRKLLIFGVVLTVLFLLTSFQRQLLHFMHIAAHTFQSNSLQDLKMPPLYNNFLKLQSTTYLGMLHYSGGVVRALLCLGVFPKFIYLVRSKVFVCCKDKK